MTAGQIAEFEAMQATTPHPFDLRSSDDAEYVVSHPDDFSDYTVAAAAEVLS